MATQDLHMACFRLYVMVRAPRQHYRHIVQDSRIRFFCASVQQSGPCLLLTCGVLDRRYCFAPLYFADYAERTRMPNLPAVKIEDRGPEDHRLAR